MEILAEIIHRLFQFLTIIVIVKVVLSYFMSPFDPIRRTIDRIIDPLLAPIKRYVPPVGMLDLSPIVLIILIQIIDMIIMNILI